MRGLSAIALLLVGTTAYASPRDPCLLTSAVKDAKLTISIPGGRTSFREGGIIPLALSFTSTAAKRYWAESRNYDRSGRLSIETYCLEPPARDPLADYFRTGTFIGGGLGGDYQLSEKPFTASAELNEWKQPAPGHYRLYVVSHRVWRPPDPDESTAYDRVSVTLRSNTIEFDIVKADAEWRAEQLRDATAIYEHAAGAEQKEAARRLRFLNSKESVQTLARLYWGLNDQPGGWDLMFGLFGSPNHGEAIAAMQREINNPGHPITQDFLNTLVRLQIDTDPAWAPPPNDPAQPKVWQEYWSKWRLHERELMRAVATVTAAALPRKTGKARALTVVALAASPEFLSPVEAAQMREELIAEWPDLPERTKLNLIQFGSSLPAGPEMLPILGEFVSGPPPPFRSEAWMAREAALKHIFDLDPHEGRSLILRDLGDPDAQPSIALVKLLSPAALQPFVRQAVDRIEENDGRGLDFHLLELFGDKSQLSLAERVFNERVGQWGCDPQDAMLRYFLRLDPPFGVKAVQASLAARGTTGCYRTLLQDMGKALTKIQPLAIRALDDQDLEVANDAALALGRWGTATAEPALWARLERFHREWQGRENELHPTPNYRGPIAHATALESTLVNSIATGTSWLCGPDKFERLRALASPRERLQISAWGKQWRTSGAVILPNWFPEDHLSFQVLQYSNLDLDQLRAKLSQLPVGTKLYFQIRGPGKISPPVSMKKQRAVFQALREYAQQLGLTIQEKSDP